MKKYTNWWAVSGAIVGTVGGYLYWQEVGCQMGHCPIRSHWQTMSIWGGVTGFLATDLLHQTTQTVLSWYRTTRKTTW